MILVACCWFLFSLLLASCGLHIVGYELLVARCLCCLVFLLVVGVVACCRSCVSLALVGACCWLPGLALGSAKAGLCVNMPLIICKHDGHAYK